MPLEFLTGRCYDNEEDKKPFVGMAALMFLCALVLLTMSRLPSNGFLPSYFVLLILVAILFAIIIADDLRKPAKYGAIIGVFAAFALFPIHFPLIYLVGGIIVLGELIFLFDERLPSALTRNTVLKFTIERKSHAIAKATLGFLLIFAAYNISVGLWTIVAPGVWAIIAVIIANFVALLSILIVAVSAVIFVLANSLKYLIIGRTEEPPVEIPEPQPESRVWTRDITPTAPEPESPVWNLPKSRSRVSSRPDDPIRVKRRKTQTRTRTGRR